MRNLFNKKILLFLIVPVLLLGLTGCDTKITPEDKLNSALVSMNDVKQYLLSTELRYSDTEKTINASFKSGIDIDDEIHGFEGIANCNDATFNINGYMNGEHIVLNDYDENIVKLNFPYFNIKDLKFSNIEEITDRAGNEDLDYYITTINDLYEAKIGVGKKDNVIYTIYIDLKNEENTTNIVSIYEVEISISDKYEEIGYSLYEDFDKIENDFLNIFNNIPLGYQDIFDDNVTIIETIGGVE